MKKAIIQEPTRLSDADLYGIYRSWRDNTGAFECFVRSTCFVSLKHYPDFELEHPAFRRGAVCRKVTECVKSELQTCEALETKTLFLLDLPAKKSLPLSLLLNQDCGLQPVLTMRQLYHPHGVVGETQDISALLKTGPKLRHEEPKGYVFVLDSNRCTENDGEIFTEKFNNQYELTAYDLPLPEMLHDTGYSKLVLMHSGALKRDVAQYIGNLRIAGFNAGIVRVEGHEQ